MYIDNKDKIVEMLLLNSHEGDFTYKRPDSSTYVRQIRKNKEDTFYTPTKQTEFNLKSKPCSKLNPNAPHLNILNRYYGDDWVPIDQNLPPH